MKQPGCYLQLFLTAIQFLFNTQCWKNWGRGKKKHHINDNASCHISLAEQSDLVKNRSPNIARPEYSPDPTLQIMALHEAQEWYQKSLLCIHRSDSTVHSSRPDSHHKGGLAAVAGKYVCMYVCVCACACACACACVCVCARARVFFLYISLLMYSMFHYR